VLGFRRSEVTVRSISRASAAIFAAASLWLALSPATPAQAPYDVKANYVKRELYIPMRDGVKLFTIVYSPKDTTRPYPLLMTRTAYGIAPYGPESFRAVIGPNN
jgi:predicted acyl esterase